MNLRKHLTEIYNYLQSDKTLLRLLYYKPKNAFDDPLSPTKPEIFDIPEKHEAIKKILVPSDKTLDLTVEYKICRICMYNGNRKPQRNYFSADQDFVLDVYVHYEIDEIDFRLSWICDHLNDLIFNNSITGAGNVQFVMGHPLQSTPNGYIGYKLVYKFIGLED